MWEPGGSFQYREGKLCCGRVPLEEIVARFSTPTFVYDGQAIARQCRQIRKVFSGLDCEFFYAVKANSTLAILQRIAEQGFGFDVVSGGELQRLHRLGTSGERIIFSGVGKSRAELELARSLNIRSINIESLPELKLVAEMSRPGPSIRVGLRVNPQVAVQTHPYVSTGRPEHKFGIPLGHFAEAIEILHDSRLQLQSIGCHLGSQLRNPQPYLAALDQLLELRGQMEAQGIFPPALDLGGGFGIAYHESESELDLQELAERLRRREPGTRFLFEPGRRVVAEAGVLLTRILYEKSTPQKNFLVCDAAMNDLIRPALYGATHRVLSLREAAPMRVGDLVGPICESGDFLARDVPLPGEPGGCLAILDAGAYGMALSSNYNSRLRAAEVLIDEDEVRLIRRRETFEDLIRCELPG